MSQSVSRAMYQVTFGIARRHGMMQSRPFQPPLAPPVAGPGYLDPFSNRAGFMTGAGGAEAPSPGAKALLGQ